MNRYPFMHRHSILGILLALAIISVWLFRRYPTSPPPQPPERVQSVVPATPLPTPAISAPQVESAKIHPAATPLPKPNDTPVPQASATAPLVAPPLTVPDAEAVASAPASAGDIQAELDNVQFAIRDFRMALGENPIGNNAEITKALLGDNLKQARVPVPLGSNVNGDGELCDPWGTPYFFHQLSKNSMEIRSAGADRRMWTGDDRLVK